MVLPSVGSGGRTGHYATPGYDERWDHERAALDAERVRLLYVAATRARDHLVVPCVKGKGKPGPFLELLEPLLPEAGRHEVEVDGAWLLDAAQLQLPPYEEQAAPEPGEAAVDRALEDRSTWQVDNAAALRDARRELPFIVASSVERATRPLASEASSASSALLLSEGPPLPVGDALHLVMERVSLPEATDLDEVVESVCAEAGLLDRTGEVQEMAARCLSSAAVRRALASGAYWREVPFTVIRGGGFAVGRVDLVYREGDALVVVDYKSDEVDAAQVEGHARPTTPVRRRCTRRHLSRSPVST
jgi:ATP-dependent exoDNAse (exonuclease V) beta subunit